MFVLVFAAASLKADKDLVLAAVALNGRAIEHASPALKADKAVVLVALQHGVALSCASDALKADKDLVIAAVALNGRAIEHASPELQADPEVIAAARRSTIDDLTRNPGQPPHPPPGTHASSSPTAPRSSHLTARSCSPPWPWR